MSTEFPSNKSENRGKFSLVRALQPNGLKKKGKTKRKEMLMEMEENTKEENLYIQTGSFILRVGCVARVFPWNLLENCPRFLKWPGFLNNILEIFGFFKLYKILRDSKIYKILRDTKIYKIFKNFQLCSEIVKWNVEKKFAKLLKNFEKKSARRRQNAHIADTVRLYWIISSHLFS